MRIALGVLDRIALLNILPREGDFRTLKVVQDLRINQLGFSEEELQQLQFRDSGDGKTIWNRNGDIPKIIDIGKVGYQIIVDTLRQLEQQKHLQLDHLHLYEMFVMDEQDPATAVTHSNGNG